MAFGFGILQTHGYSFTDLRVGLLISKILLSDTLFAFTFFLNDIHQTTEEQYYFYL